MMDKSWTLNPDEYSSIKNESRKIILHPRMAELIRQKNGVKILDYGCGDGSFIQHLHHKCEIALYDISKEILEKAEKNLKIYNPKVHIDRTTIPDNYFDYVIFSLVMMMIPTKAEIIEELRKIQSSLRWDGIAIIAITHPCFRQEVFSTFQTAYSKGKNFKYFQEGEKFEVWIRDIHLELSTTLYDYHWTLETTINLITGSGLTIRNFIEIPDHVKNHSYYNSSFSPYIIIECTKNKTG
ncbi:MAG TPA: class I SAM-dependent methyltransferase [Saprospiraceae bacterium]|nr:class I SAM-dependent methyltransferase [Saprospiraceae bacterium]